MIFGEKDDVTRVLHKIGEVVIVAVFVVATLVVTVFG
jgi:hypothetical protein